MGREDPAHNTGDLAYRVLVRKEDIEAYEARRIERGEKDVGLGALVKKPAINFWLGSTYIVHQLFSGPTGPGGALHVRGYIMIQLRC